MLTESQILLLNNLIYRDEFSNQDKTINGKERTVGEILESISENIPDDGTAAMNTEEWRDIYEMAKSDESICNLKVTNGCQEKETGAKMACFVDKRGQAYAVFAGTGANEWRDDCVAGTQADSVQQQKALDWFDNLPYDNIVVSGHSKGGNKAMYTAILSDKAGECYAFDGEGFSYEFYIKYSDLIKQKANKIHLRANYRDFVNALLLTIAGDVKYVVNDGGVDNPGQYHCPNALFKYEKGFYSYNSETQSFEYDGDQITYSIGDFGKQDPAMEMLHNFTVYLLDNATEEEKIVALSVLGELLTKFLGGEEGVVREDILSMFGVEGGEIIIRYLTKYLQDLKKSDPSTYYKYLSSFAEFAVDGGSIAFWMFILGNLGVKLLPDSKIKLFEELTNGVVQATLRAVINRGRDFSQSIKETMIESARETEDEDWWQVTKWDCWYKIEKLFGGMQWDQYTCKVDEYYRKLIDMNDASVKDIERIFDEVYKIDSEFASKMEQKSNELDSVMSKLQKISESIVPSCT